MARQRREQEPPLHLVAVIGACALAMSACGPGPSNAAPVRTPLLGAAIRASVLLGNGSLPDADRAAILQSPGAGYAAYVDKLVDPERNPAFGWSMRRYFLGDMELEDRVVDIERASDGSVVEVNLADGADLATYLVTQKRPFTELLTSSECVRANKSALASENAALTFERVPCTTDTPVHAGLMTQQGFLLAVPSSTGLERARVWKLYFSCENQTVSSDPGWTSCNTCEGDVNRPLSPTDASGPDPRMHAKYSVPSNDSWCATCHHWLNPRRQLFVKYDEQGFYERGRTLFDAESPENNFGRCMSPPVGAEMSDLVTCPSAGYAGPQGEDWPFDCCFDPTMTDANATGFIATSPFACIDPEAPFCTGEYYGEKMEHLAQWGEAMAEGDLDGGLFASCASTRIANYFLGRDRGNFRNRIADRPPAPLPLELQKRLVRVFEGSGADLSAVMRAILLDPAFIDASATLN